MENNGFLLIHGAGLGSFIWDEVREFIRYPVLSIDLPNRNLDFKSNRKLSFEDYIYSIVRRVEKWDVQKFIIVAHSISGCLGLTVAEFFRSRVVGFIAVGAAIPVTGSSFISCLPFPQRIILPVIISLAGTRPPEKTIEKGLCNDLSEEQKYMVIKNFTPESKSLYLGKCKAGIPDTKRLYVVLCNDNEFPPALQYKMAENLKAHRTVTIQSGHLPMMSKPEEVARILIRFYNEVLLEMNYLKN